MDHQPSQSAALLRVENLEFRYAHGPSDWALRVPDLSLEGGVMYRLFGDNMSGKTTFLRILTGSMSVATSVCRGHLAFGAKRLLVPPSPSQAKRAGIAAVHQSDAMFPSLSTWDNVQVAAPSERDLRRRAEVRLWLDGQLRQLSPDLDSARPLESLSGGARAIVRLVRATVWGYRLLCLDEPTSNLDLENRRRWFEMLAASWKSDKALVLVSHAREDHEQLRAIASARSAQYRRLRLVRGTIAVE